MGTVDAPMIASRVMSMSLPVERSITVSAPYLTASRSLPTSSSMEEETAELPMFALILTEATLPMAMGSSLPARWWVLAGMTRRPRATSARMSSGSRDSRWATKRMAGVISPLRAKAIWVLAVLRVDMDEAGIVDSLRRYEPDQVLRVFLSPRAGVARRAPRSLEGILVERREGRE